MKKSICSLFLATILVAGGASNKTFANSSNDFLLFVNGKELQTEDMFAKDNRIFIPLRSVTEKLGYTVNYEPKDQSITVVNNKTNLKMKLDSKEYTVNDKEFKMDTTPVVKNNRTYVPIRFIGESFGVDVQWNSQHKLALVGKHKGTELKDSITKNFDDFNLTMQVPKDFDEKIVVKKENGEYNFYDKYSLDQKEDGFIARLTKTSNQHPYSHIVPGFIIDYKDGTFTEFSFVSDVRYTDKTEAKYKESFELMKQVSETINLK